MSETCSDRDSYVHIKWHEVKGRVHIALYSEMEKFSTSWRHHKQLPVSGEMGGEPQTAENRNGLVERKTQGIPGRQSDLSKGRKVAGGEHEREHHHDCGRGDRER